MSEKQHLRANPRRIQRLQLEAYDDVVSIRDRLQFVEAGRVLLVFPARHRILQRKLDLVLIQREAMRRNLRLALVTHDATVVDHAKELNISTFGSVEQARTQRWKRPDSRVFVDKTARPQSRHDSYDLMLAASRLKPPLTPVQRNLLYLFRGIVFGVTALVLLFGIYAVVPGATVTLRPASDQLNVSIRIMADPSITTSSPESLRVPADIQRFIQDATVTIETTGIRRAENSLADGVVVFTNNAGLATLIEAGTIVTTEGNVTSPPVEFETLTDVSLAARQGATVSVNIRARAIESSQGLNGNVGPNTIIIVTGELADAVSVINPQSTFGGGLRETAIVTENDRARLITLARQQVIQNARNFLISSLDESENLPVLDSMRIVEERALFYSADVNQPSETVSLTLQAVVETIVIDLNEARLVAFANLNNYITPGRVLDEKSLRFRQGEIQEIFEDGRVAFQMRVEGNSRVDLDETTIRERLTGMSESEARQVLENEYLLDPRYPPRIDTFPSFWGRMPLLSIRITVEITGS